MTDVARGMRAIATDPRGGGPIVRTSIAAETKLRVAVSIRKIGEIRTAPGGGRSRSSVGVGPARPSLAARKTLGTCASCGAAFDARPTSRGRPRAYCASCRPRRTPEDRLGVCVQCGGFALSPDGKGRPRRFCSEQCRRAYRPGAPRPCDQCGRDFRPAQSSSEGRFCCASCYYTGRRLEPRTCAGCGVLFRPGARAQRFHSVSCAASASNIARAISRRPGSA